jgi:RNA polymerase sigma-70 factor (ECF subfamily)
MVALYDGLLALRPSIGARVSRACALGAASGPAEGLRALDVLAPGDVSDYQPYWAARAHLLGQAGRPDEARQAYARAAGLSTSAAVRTHLATAASRL